MNLRVILADDHQIVREGLRLILDRAQDIEVIGEARDGRSTVELARQLRPDVVVMDIGMPDLNGMEATRQVVAARPQAKVIGLSAYADRRYVVGMLEAGASGYVVKAAAGEDLVRAVRAVCQGKKYLSPEVAGIVVGDYVTHRPADNKSAMHTLSSREREVLQLLAEGNTSKQIALQLGLSVRTVETHRRNIMKRLDLHSVADLVKYALREGVTQLDGDGPPWPPGSLFDQGRA